VDAEGETSYTKLIGHAKAGRLHWREVPQEELEQEAGKTDEAKFRRHKPSMDEFLTLFPTTFKKHPREALLSGDQIKNTFLDRGWHRDFYRGLSDQAESEQLIAWVRGDGRGGQVLRGLPAIIEAYKTLREERDTLMKDVPLEVTAKRVRSATKKRR